MATQLTQASEELEYVGFWLRLGASVVDTVFQLILLWVIVAVFFGGGFHSFSVTVTGPMAFLLNYVFPIVLVLAFWIKFGATPGKMMIRAKIVDATTGEQPSSGQFIIRYLSYFLSFAVFCLGMIWIAFDSRKQGWHDKLAGTVVVRTKHSASVKFVQ